MEAVMNVQEAVRIAMDYVGSFDRIFPSEGLRLEETEIDQDGNWLITLSFLESHALGPRVFKRFVIDPNNQQVVAMKMRNPLAA